MKVYEFRGLGGVGGRGFRMSLEPGSEFRV